VSKLCGFWREEPTPEGGTVLRAMVDAMRHGSEAAAASVTFDGGGLAVLGTALSDPNGSLWTRDEREFLALGGRIVGERSGSVFGLEPGVLADGIRSVDDGLLARLDGVFTLVHVGVASRTLTIANDRLGFSPVYYHWNGRELWFASEVKAILRVLRLMEPDWQAWADFHYIGLLMGTATLVSGVVALDAGHVLTVRGGILSVRPYYDFTRIGLREPGDVTTREVAERFLEAVDRRLRPGVRHTLLLSGGFDSRLILGALTRLGARPTVLALENADDHHGLDGAVARRLAASLGLECEWRPHRPGYAFSGAWAEVFYILDGMVPNLDLFISRIYPELDERLGVVWDGLGLDIMLGAFHGVTADQERNLALFIAQRSTVRSVLRAALVPEVFARLDDGFEERIWEHFDAVPPSENAFFLFLLKHRTRRRIAVNPHQLYASRVEPETPSVHRSFHEYVLSIPYRMRAKNRLYIDVLEKEFPDLARVPVCSAGTVYLSRRDWALVARHLDWLAPLKHRLELHPRLVTVARKARDLPGGGSSSAGAASVAALLERTEFRRPFYDRPRLLPLFEAYRKGNRRHHRLFKTVYYIELWHALFVDHETSVLEAGHPATPTRTIPWPSPSWSSRRSSLAAQLPAPYS
jgi:asparagine synthetase B (glutamine-hydrolysing)